MDQNADTDILPAFTDNRCEVVDSLLRNPILPCFIYVSSKEMKNFNEVWNSISYRDRVRLIERERKEQNKIREEVEIETKVKTGIYLKVV